MGSTSLTHSIILSTRKADNRPPEVSIAVSTYNRPDLLRRLLDALMWQTMDKERFELVLVDNASTPETAELIRKLGQATGLQIHALRIETNRGPVPARNLAWREARAETIAFTDDDCAPDQQWLERGLEAVRSTEAVIVGRTLPNPRLPMGPFSRTVYALDANWLPTCNVFYRRADLDAVDGFDETFVKPGAEDTDLGYRVHYQCRRELRFAPDVLVYHDVRPSRFIDAAKESQRWSAMPRFFRTHPESRANLHRRIFWKASHPKALLAAAGLILTTRSNLFLLLLLPWLHYRTRVRRPLGWKKSTIALLPGVLIVDLLEVVAMVRGSLRYRTLVL